MKSVHLMPLIAIKIDEKVFNNFSKWGEIVMQYIFQRKFAL